MQFQNYARIYIYIYIYIILTKIFRSFDMYNSNGMSGESFPVIQYLKKKCKKKKNTIIISNVYNYKQKPYSLINIFPYIKYLRV